MQRAARIDSSTEHSIASTREVLPDWGGPATWTTARVLMALATQLVPSQAEVPAEDGLEETPSFLADHDRPQSP